MKDTLFATRIPEHRAEAIRAEAERQRRTIADVVDAALVSFLNLSESLRDRRVRTLAEPHHGKAGK